MQILNFKLSPFTPIFTLINDPVCDIQYVDYGTVGTRDAQPENLTGNSLSITDF